MFQRLPAGAGPLAAMLCDTLAHFFIERFCGGDEEALSHGVYQAYTENNLRYSQNAAVNMWDEKNTGTNLPGRPSMGSWLLYGLGSDTDNLPGYVVMMSSGRGGMSFRAKPSISARTSLGSRSSIGGSRLLMPEK